MPYSVCGWLSVNGSCVLVTNLCDQIVLVKSLPADYNLYDIVCGNIITPFVCVLLP